MQSKEYVYEWTNLGIACCKRPVIFARRERVFRSLAHEQCLEEALTAFTITVCLHKRVGVNGTRLAQSNANIGRRNLSSLKILCDGFNPVVILVERRLSKGECSINSTRPGASERMISDGLQCQCGGRRKRNVRGYPVNFMTTVCQRLTGMKLRTEVLEDEVRPLNKKAFRSLRNFKKEFNEMIVDVRRISSNLQPSVLDDFGLVTALRLLCNEFGKHYSVKDDIPYLVIVLD